MYSAAPSGTTSIYCLVLGVARSEWRCFRNGAMQRVDLLPLLLREHAPVDPRQLYCVGVMSEWHANDKATLFWRLMWC